MVIYEGLGHSQPTTASRMIQKVSKNQAVALLPRFRPISRCFRQNSQIARTSGILEPTTDLGQFGDRIPSCMAWGARTLFWSALGASNEPLPWYYGNFRFGILICSFDLEHCVVPEFLQNKTNRWNWNFLNVLERSRLDPNDAFGMKEIHRHNNLPYTV